MKKFLAIFLAVVLLGALCMGVLATAEEFGAKETTELFWVTQYNDGTAEGAGVIFTEEDTAGGWWIHVAFGPTDTDNVYEIAEIINGLEDGTATVVEVPEGGFVWAANYGNDYISLGSGDTDFTSETCSAAIERAKTWIIGQQFRIEGIDFETVPTTTPDIKWYEDGYICTAIIAPYQAPQEESGTQKDPLEALREELIALVGETNPDALFGWNIRATTAKDGVVTVVLTIQDMVDEAGLQGVAGQLHYDAEALTLLTESNNENELQCVTSLPSDRWENMSYVTRDDEGEIIPGVLDLAVVNASDNTVITEDAPVILTLQFQMNEDYTYSGIYMPTESVYGLDSNVDEVAGNGAYAIVQAATAEEEPSDDSSAPPKPGDGGIVWFALLGAASLVGTIAVLKKRHAVD